MYGFKLFDQTGKLEAPTTQKNKYGDLQPKPPSPRKSPRSHDYSSIFEYTILEDATTGKKIIKVKKQDIPTIGVVFEKNENGEVVIDRRDEINNPQIPSIQVR